MLSTGAQNLTLGEGTDTEPICIFFYFKDYVVYLYIG